MAEGIGILLLRSLYLQEWSWLVASLGATF